MCKFNVSVFIFLLVISVTFSKFRMNYNHRLGKARHFRSLENDVARQHHAMAVHDYITRKSLRDQEADEENDWRKMEISASVDFHDNDQSKSEHKEGVKEYSRAQAEDVSTEGKNSTECEANSLSMDEIIDVISQLIPEERAEVSSMHGDIFHRIRLAIKYLKSAFEGAVSQTGRLIGQLADTVGDIASDGMTGSSEKIFSKSRATSLQASGIPGRLLEDESEEGGGRPRSRTSRSDKSSVRCPSPSVTCRRHAEASTEADTDRKLKKKKKFLKKILVPLLLSYKLKFFAMLPVLVSGLVLLVGTTGLAGFFFALFVASLSIKHHGSG